MPITASMAIPLKNDAKRTTSRSIGATKLDSGFIFNLLRWVRIFLNGLGQHVHIGRAIQVLGGRFGNVGIDDGADIGLPLLILFIAERDNLVFQTEGVVASFLIVLIPTLAMDVDPLAAGGLENVLELRIQGSPLGFIHDNEHRRGIAHNMTIRGVFDDFRLAPSLERFNGTEGAVHHPFLQGLVRIPLGHGHGNAAQGLDHLGAEARGTNLQFCQVGQCFNRFAGMQQTRAMGVQVKYLYIVHLRWLEFGVKSIGYIRGRYAVGIPQGQIQGFHGRKPASGVGEAGHANIGNTVDHTVIALIGLGQRPSRKDGDFDPAGAEAFNLLGPGDTGQALTVGGREKDAVGQLNRIGGSGG
ncbi:hypothetical protein DESC_290239 [Desulfosarcina cetonica]|nr:hypothetical protein DESC_290239 [Desulfosarcina cetonica]